MKTTNAKNSSVQAVIDRSNFLRALLLFIKADRNVWDHEKHVFVQEGTRLGFNKEYCEQALRDSITNKHINNQVPVFHFREYAVLLFNVGMEILIKDPRKSPMKIKFLKELLIRNNIVVLKNASVLQLFKGFHYN